jgi:hypothetical membrane protein
MLFSVKTMKNKLAVLGLAAPVVLCLFTGLSVILSPWFAWQANALSDLGNPANGEAAAAVFNSGLGVSGMLLLVYSVTCLKSQARKTSYALALTSVLLALVGVFSEAYGLLHTAVSVLMFVSLLCSSILYFAGTKSRLALVTVFAMLSWLLYIGGITGAAIPEIISWLAATPWIASSARSFLLYGKSK